MIARRFAVALVLVSSVACVPAATRERMRAEHEAGIARVPANAPAGLFAEGYWTGTMSGEPPVMTASSFGWTSGPGTATNFAPRPLYRDVSLEVTPWRDSARVALVLAPMGSNPRTPRLFPRDMRVTGDTVTFVLGYVMGWRDVSCRLVERHDASWSGGCSSPDGDRALQLALHVPRVASR